MADRETVQLGPLVIPVSRAMEFTGDTRVISILDLRDVLATVGVNPEILWRLPETEPEHG